MSLLDAGALSSSRKIGCVSVFGAPSARLQLLSPKHPARGKKHPECETEGGPEAEGSKAGLQQVDS